MLTDAELDAEIQRAKSPGPEDRCIERYGLTWEQLERFSRQPGWPLASKLAACLLEMGNIAELAYEQAVFYRMMLKEERKVQR